MTNDNGELKACPFEHKGYQGTAEFSFEDDCLHGSLVGIKDLVVYQGETLKELRQSFIEAVDDYLETCEELNLPPNKPDYTRPDSRDDVIDGLLKVKECLRHIKPVFSDDSKHQASLDNAITALSQASGSGEDALREIIEIYAGMDGFIAETAPEAYQQRILRQMYEVAAKAVSEPAKPKAEDGEIAHRLKRALKRVLHITPSVEADVIDLAEIETDIKESIKALGGGNE